MRTIYVGSGSAEKKATKTVELLTGTAALGSMAAVFLPFIRETQTRLICLAVGLAVLSLLILLNRIKYTRLIAAAALIASIAVFLPQFSRGMLFFVNDIIRLVNSRFCQQLMTFAVENYTTADTAVFFALVVGGLAFVAATLVEWEKPGYAGLAAFAVFEFFVVLRIRQNDFVLALLLTGMVICWIVSELNYNSGSANLLIVAGIAWSVCLIFSVALAGFSGSPTVGRLSTGIADGVSRIRYGESTLPEGDMKKAYKMNTGSGQVLSVSMSNPQTEYLAGFVGAEYNSDGRWTPHSAEVFEGEWNGIFRWLKQSGFEPWRQYADYTDIAAPAANEMTVSVENTGTDRRYIYTPHTLKSVNQGRFKASDDLGLKAKGIFGARSYSFTQYYSKGIDEELIISRNDAPFTEGNGLDFKRTQSVYTGFAEDVYTKISPELKTELENIFFSTDYINDDSGLYSTVTRIRAVMELRAGYTQNPPPYRDDGDFVSWFLNEARSGNSAYFAAAGVMALRAAGFPARYAEGYYISGNAENVSVTPKNAHAWAEVYVNEAGWLPVEFTPGYYTASLLNEQTVEISKDAAGGGSEQESPYNMTEDFNDDPLPLKTPDKKKTGFRLIYTVAALAVLAALSAAFLLIRRPIVLIRRKRLFAGNNAQRHIYSHIFKLLSLGGVKCDSSRPLDCVDLVCENFKGVREQEYRRMVSLMQKSVYGGTTLKDFELRSLRLFCKKLTGLLMKKSRGLVRLKLKYINII